MATWQDGPEYAPLQRPAAFAAPDAPTLTADPVAQPSVPAAPAVPPAGYQPPQNPGPQLDQLVPDQGDTRDPSQPFQVYSAVVTSGSAWGAAHSASGTPLPDAMSTWTPDQAMQTQYQPGQAPGYPPANPGSPEWQAANTLAAQPWAPPMGGQPMQPMQQLPPVQPVQPTLSMVLKAATPALLITLVLAGVIALLSPVLLMVAIPLAGQVTYRRKLARGLAWGAVVVDLGALGLAFLSDDTNYGWNFAGEVGIYLAWGLLIGIVAGQFAAIRQGLPPEK